MDGCSSPPTVPFGSDESPWQIGADVQRFTTRIDDNGDGYTDAPTVERGCLDPAQATPLGAAPLAHHPPHLRRGTVRRRPRFPGSRPRTGDAIRGAHRPAAHRRRHRLVSPRRRRMAVPRRGGLPPPAVHLRHHELQRRGMDNQCRRLSQRLVRGRARTLHRRREPAVGPLHRRDPGRL